MIKRMLIGLILVMTCFGQSNFSNDLDGNIIAFHNIIPGKTTYSEAYDHLKYIVGAEKFSVLESSDGSKYIKCSKIFDTDPITAKIYFVYFNTDSQDNPTAWGIVTNTLFGPAELINNLPAMASLFLSVEGEMISEYGKPTTAPADRYYRDWEFFSDGYESCYSLTIKSGDGVMKLKEKFVGEYK